MPGYPFQSDIQPKRVPLFAFRSGRPTLPFPHPWNYSKPIELLETYFWGSENDQGSTRHNRYLHLPGFAPILVSRDPGVIRAITTDTGDRDGQFDRDTLPSTGIARATGPDTLLYSNGSSWKRQRKLSASPFGKTTLFQPEKFHEFAETFRKTVTERVAKLRDYIAETGQTTATLRLEPEIKVVMLEMLTNNFFATEIACEELRDRFVPALERVIDHIVRDTVINCLAIPITRWPSVSRSIAQTKRDFADFDRLTDLVLAPPCRGTWPVESIQIRRSRRSIAKQP